MTGFNALLFGKLLLDERGIPICYKLKYVPIKSIVIIYSKCIILSVVTESGIVRMFVFFFI